MITAEEYAKLIGELAPSDFIPCEAIASEIIHASTLYAYIGRDIEKLPEMIRSRMKLAVALQTQAISYGGGVAEMSDARMNSVSLGSFSYSGGNSGSDNGGGNSLAPSVRAILPILIAYGRGLRACNRYREGY